jgi:hypothetical protein
MYKNHLFWPNTTPFQVSACLWKLTPEPELPRKNILSSIPS